MKFTLDTGTDYPLDQKERISYHPDLGWAVYKQYGNSTDWERETDLTHADALSMLQEVWLDSDEINMPRFDWEWDCKKCKTHNEDNYYLSRSVVCEQCNTWYEWVDVAPMDVLDSFWWLRVWYDEKQAKQHLI